MIQNIIQIGNSHGVIIPKQILKQLDLFEGKKIALDFDIESQHITLRPPHSQAKSAITPEFKSWLDDFKKKNYAMLKELAKTQ
ncbi:hypothetical protein CO051_02515 [Candidatus Roizmanbacteria bacterium CG_4_9_14_0_2_um_filter_39_13]|uniref:SpoVT-AbrB domain-containing protein n=2 Tax=Candidatus Roizmaniibacteriota TaxID=1752723 RepID=A0A2M8F0F0_9BACT|nr:MAG: hypothetical protein COY15_03480 [Candidatus Roizmanbacteria bacterium CG_4_10_14_0_2_um_filter_39_12]PJC32772.1 MAG: hypothetical protein CO051_02515 [Candidatus Roizmanbacteria bacterium CG_4_9_14_0_2_um_filter_39_13]PJE61304.1 MAG: hypothetical protein COU87_05260 [Candidatus Roizmanbacteria bacterium CG10_big_fil_rev_8_21_14_0_10_39_12]